MTSAQILRQSKNIFMAISLLLLVSCGGGSTGGSTPTPLPPAPDTVPDIFIFSDQVGVEFDTVIQSDTVTITGIDAAATISITGGKYSIDGGTFIATNGTITNGQTVTLQQTSAATSKTLSDAVVTIGGISDTFSVTTVLVLNTDFVKKTEIITLSGINIYEGYVDINNAGIVEPDLSALNSGDLLTIDIVFDISELPVTDYAFAVQLMPQSVVSQFGAGSTLGEILTKDFVANAGEKIIDLGGIHLELTATGETHAVLQAKLPALEQDTDYRILVTPDISYLAGAATKTQREELALIPILIKKDVLTIKRLESVVINVIEPPKLLDTNDFTHVEVASSFGADGFSTKPIFQSQIKVDVTSFNPNETIELSMSWTTSTGETFQLGLMGVDDTGKPMVSENARFQVTRDGGQSIQLPVVAYVSQAVNKAMLDLSTNIRDIADRDPELADFVLELKVIDSNGNSGVPITLNFTLPLVSQDLRAVVQSEHDIAQFTVLRAGITNSACLFVGTDIDTGFIVPGDTPIFAGTCSDWSNMLWRYDYQTKQIIHRKTDIDGNNYCIQFSGSGFLPDTFTLTKCKFESAGSAIGHSSQRFIFKNGEGIIGEQIPLYLTVNFSNSASQTVGLTMDINEAPNFFSDSNGVDIDRNGRVFNLGDYSSLNFGDPKIVAIDLNYGGEASIDFKPVPGIVAKGKATLSATIFKNANHNLVSVSFEYQKHLSKQLSFLAGNLAPVKVKNGSEVIFELLGVDVAKRGEIIETIVTESYFSGDNAENVLNSEKDPGVIGAYSGGNDDYNQLIFGIRLIIYGIPVSVEARLEGALTLNGALNEIQPFGLSVNLASKMRLAAVLSAKVDASIVAAGIDATMTMVDKSLIFDASGQLNASTDLTAPKLTYTTNASLRLDLEVLKGKIAAFIEYPHVCFCRSFGETVHKDITLYESPSLMSFHTNIFEGSAVALEFGL